MALNLSKLQLKNNILFR